MYVFMEFHVNTDMSYIYMKYFTNYAFTRKISLWLVWPIQNDAKNLEND